MLAKLFYVLAIAWPVTEAILGLFSRAKRDSATVRDHGSLVLLWSSIAVGIAAANFIRSSGAGSIGAPPTLFLSVALAFLLSGLALRWTAILTLGRFFTPNVAVHPDQRIVRTGVYRYVRHPAYTGLLLAFLGGRRGFQQLAGSVSHFHPGHGCPVVSDASGRTSLGRDVGTGVHRLPPSDQATGPRHLLVFGVPVLNSIERPRGAR